MVCRQKMLFRNCNNYATACMLHGWNIDDLNYDLESYHFSNGTAGDGYFNLNTGDRLGLNGYLISNGGWIYPSSPDLDITWYDTNGNVLASGVNFYDVDSSISGVYVTVEYEGVNYGMSPEDAFQKTGITTNSMYVTGQNINDLNDDLESYHLSMVQRLMGILI